METLKINGVERQFETENFPENMTELLKQLKVDAATIVAEVDGNIVERQNFDATKLQQGQNIELIRFVPGG